MQKSCKKCGSEFTAYNTVKSLCYGCEKEKHLLVRENTDRAAEKRKQGKNNHPNDDKLPETHTSLSPHVKGVGERKKSGKKNGRIKETARHKEERAKLAEIKADKIAEIGQCCESCGKSGHVDLSHFIAGAKGIPFRLDPEASCLQDRECHNSYEHLVYSEIAKFKNLQTILDFLGAKNPTRYQKIVDGIKNLGT